MIRTAVVPAAGLGTRLLPATRSVPKEMLPVVDRPVLHRVVAEAAEAGLEEVLIVTGRGRRVIEDHFGDGAEPEHCRIRYVAQSRPQGLGHAVLQAREHTGDEPFCVLLGDSILAPRAGAELARLVAAREETGAPVVALETVPRGETDRRGVVRLANPDEPPAPGERVRITGFVEKPEPEEAPSRFCVAARYVLGPDVYPILADLEPGLGGEIQLTDALDRLASERPVYGVALEGRRFDVGNIPDYARTFLAFALDHPEVGPAVADELVDHGWRRDG